MSLELLPSDNGRTSFESLGTGDSEALAAPYERLPNAIHLSLWEGYTAVKVSSVYCLNTLCVGGGRNSPLADLRLWDRQQHDSAVEHDDGA